MCTLILGVHACRMLAGFPSWKWKGVARMSAKVKVLNRFSSRKRRVSFIDLTATMQSWPFEER